MFGRGVRHVCSGVRFGSSLRIAVVGQDGLVGLARPRRRLATAVTTPLIRESPQDEDEEFEVQIADSCFSAYEMESPSSTLTVTKRELRQLYRDMFKIRRMDMAIDGLYKQRKVRGFCHLSVGQEAVAVGIEHGIAEQDKVITAYRCHGNVLMRGATIQQIVGEVLGRRNGLNFGKGGSVHMYHKNFFGGNGIVGAQVPVGAGIAFAQQYNETGHLTVNMYGDGAANQGQVFEAFNMAKLWDLPCLFICENNKFGMGTAVSRASASTEFHKRGQYIPGLRVDAMNVLAVLAAIKHGRKFIAEGNGPLIFEMTTYRFFGHSVSDPGKSYRTRKEVQKVRQAEDPIFSFQIKLVDEWKIFTAEELKELEHKVQQEINEGVKEAEKGVPPDAVPSVLFEDSYVRGSEPDYIRGRTPDENYYFASR